MISSRGSSPDQEPVEAAEATTVVGAAEATEGKATAVTKGTATQHLQQCTMGYTIINIEMMVYPN